MFNYFFVEYNKCNNTISPVIQTITMASMKFKCRASNDAPFVLKTYPRFPSRLEEVGNSIVFGLQVKTSGLVPNDVVTLQIDTSLTRTLEVTHITPQLFRILCQVLKHSGKANMFVCDTPDVEFGKTRRTVALLKIKRFVATPVYVLVTDNSSNFFAGYAIQKALRNIRQAKRERPHIRYESLLAVARSALPLEETFDTQFIHAAAMRTEYSRNQSIEQEYSISTSEAVDLIDQRQRQSEYLQFVDRQQQEKYPDTNDGSIEFVKGELIKNKQHIRALSEVSKRVEQLETCIQKNQTFIPSNISESLDNISESLEEASSQYKCCQCMDSWRDCMLVNCYHMAVCKSCIAKNRHEYSRFSCPICKSLCSFILTDADL